MKPLLTEELQAALDAASKSSRDLQELFKRCHDSSGFAAMERAFARLEESSGAKAMREAANRFDEISGAKAMREALSAFDESSGAKTLREAASRASEIGEVASQFDCLPPSTTAAIDAARDSVRVAEAFAAVSSESLAIRELATSFPTSALSSLELAVSVTRGVDRSIDWRLTAMSLMEDVPAVIVPGFLTNLGWVADDFASLRLGWLDPLQNIAALVDEIRDAWPPAYDDDAWACTQATNHAVRNREDLVRTFTTQTLGLPPPLVGEVARLLIEGHWRNAARPLAYLRVSAKRAWAQKERRNCFLSGRRVDLKSVEHELRGADEATSSIGQHEAAARLQVLRAHFTEEEWLFQERQAHGYGRVQMMREFNYSERDVERLRKSFRRKRARIPRALRDGLS